MRNHALYRLAVQLYYGLVPEGVDAGDTSPEGTDALETAGITLDRGHLAGLWFLRARARRAENGAGRRVDMTFRARIDLG